MRTTTLLLGLLLLSGYQAAGKQSVTSTDRSSTTSPDTNSAVDKANRSTARQFEIAIANTIIKDIARAYPELEGSHRVSYLNQKFEQLQRSVDFHLVNAATRRQRDILAWLLTSEEEKLLEEKRLQKHFKKKPGGRHHYLSELNRLASLHWRLADYESAVEQEAVRINQAIERQSQNGIETDIETIRQATRYPEDTINGRQDYLDQLAGEMIASQHRWHNAPDVYPESPIGFEGFEESSVPGIFTYEKASGTLRINLSDVTNLPLFELPSVAVYYGFPGLHSLHSDTLTGDSLQQHLRLPGFSLGWAAYISEFLISGGMGNELPDEAQLSDPKTVLHHLYFQRLLTGLALVDLRLHTYEEAIHEGVVREKIAREWTDDEALAYLLQTTPYEASRLATLVREVRSRPGYYLAALAGKSTFADLQSACLQKPSGCEVPGLHQAIITIGPVPFKLLYDTLGL